MGSKIMTSTHVIFPGPCNRVSSRFCSSSLCWFPAFVLATPLPILNPAARVILAKHKLDYGIPLLKTLQWGPILCNSQGHGSGPWGPTWSGPLSWSHLLSLPCSLGTSLAGSFAFPLMCQTSSCHGTGLWTCSLGLEYFCPVYGLLLFFLQVTVVLCIGEAFFDLSVLNSTSSLPCCALYSSKDFYPTNMVCGFHIYSLCLLPTKT